MGTLLTAVVLVGTVVAIRHAIAVVVPVDALSVSAYELRRQASCTHTNERIDNQYDRLYGNDCLNNLCLQSTRVENNVLEPVRVNVTEERFIISFFFVLFFCIFLRISFVHST